MQDFTNYLEELLQMEQKPHTMSQKSACNYNKDCIDSLPLTMAYVPMQAFKDVYEPMTALANGTLFPELNKPFKGKFVKWR